MTEIVCAAFVRQSEVLLVRRAPHRKWYPDHWDLVGGHVDQGEDIQQALVRECVEEVGLRPTNFELIDMIFEAEDRKEKTHSMCFWSLDGQVRKPNCWETNIRS